MINKIKIDTSGTSNYGAENTIREILQQPQIIEDTLKRFNEIEELINLKLDKLDDYDIIFCGAGTSEFIGNAIYENLNANTSSNKFYSIASTSIIANPERYFYDNRKVILVSFGRSGNSPESIESVNLANQILGENVFHIIITCNINGKLSNYNNENGIVINLSDKSHDIGFAMTSSYTGMMSMALLIFDRDKEMIKETTKTLDQLMNYCLDFSYNNTDLKKERYIFLGSDNYQYIAQEGALKLLELCNGKMSTTFNTPLGFRHGPKIFVNSTTKTFVMLSSNCFTRKYEKDLVDELYSNNRGNEIIVIDLFNDKTLVTDNYYGFNTHLKDMYAGMIYIVFLQLFAVSTSINLGIESDNPSSDDSVNRVVQGVRIHGYE